MRLKFVLLQMLRRKYLCFKSGFQFIQCDAVMFKFGFHFPIIGIARKWIEAFKPVSFCHRNIECVPGLVPIAPSNIKKNAGEQCANSEDNQKCPEPSVLLEPVHGIFIGLRRSSWSS